MALARARRARRALVPILGVAIWLVAAPSGAAPPMGEHVATPDDAREPTAPAEDSEAALVAEIDERGVYDPLEPMNRVFFAVNRGFDFVFLDPVSKAYGFLLPDFAKLGVRRMFDNLNSPSILANDLIQLELRDAVVTTLRFVINTTLGLAGFLDPMAENGFPGHHSDFGQTLWRVGVGPGPYFVVPVLGPTTARDGIGTFVDGFFRPQAWLLGPGERLILTTTDGITLREANLEGIEALRESSVDYYSALRGAFVMNREGELRKEAARRAERPPLCGSSPAVAAPAPAP
jgi:phospholipid-binding lipoprotein MlaA